MSEVTDIRRRVDAIRSVHSDAALTQAASEHQRIAERYAAELIDKLGIPHTYDEAVTMVAVAYLEGEIAQLKVARDSVRGDGS